MLRKNHIDQVIEEFEIKEKYATGDVSNSLMRLPSIIDVQNRSHSSLVTYNMQV